MENLNYFPTDAYAHVCRPEFITRVVLESDVSLVLDLAHAIVSTKNLGMDVLSYLCALPLERVCEVHLSAPRELNYVWRDMHESPTEREYALLGAILPRLPRHAYVAVENFASWEGVVADYLVLVDFLQKKDALHDVSCNASCLR